MEEYDEQPLKQRFAANLSSDKAYLYEAILRSMRDYRSQSSKAAQVKERLMDARFLYERGLYDQSTERISEAKAMASELEDQFTLLEINREEQVSLFDRRAKVQLEHIEKLNEERERTLKAIDEELRYLDLYYRLLLELYKDFNPDEQKDVVLKKSLPIELLDESNFPSSIQAQRRYYQCQYVYYNMLGDLTNEYFYSKKAVEWWDNHPVLKEEEFHRYVNNVSNLVNTCYKMESKINEAHSWFERLKNEKSGNSIHNQAVVFRYLALSKLLYHLNKNEFKEASKLLPDIIDGINKFGLKKNLVLVLAANIVTVYFLIEDYENCIEWVDKITKSMKSSGRLDIHRVARIYKVISLYELDEFEKMELEIRAANRYFKINKTEKEAIEEIVLNVYLRDIFDVPVSAYKKAVRNLINYLTEIKSIPHKEGMLGVDEFLIWANSKIR
jgi:hypothetical protein